MSGYLFVYGTLRKRVGLPLTKQVEKHWTYIATAKLPARLYDLGDYPGAIADRGGELIGDLYKLEDEKKVLAILDEYEGIPADAPDKGEFIRKKATVRLRSGRTVQTWVYWYNQDPGIRQPVPYKDYLNYLKYKRTI